MRAVWLVRLFWLYFSFFLFSFEPLIIPQSSALVAIVARMTPSTCHHPRPSRVRALAEAERLYSDGVAAGVRWLRRCAQAFACTVT
eukprot:COSAG01_NODE_1807_length_9189_cov_24.677778_8_plen_86_part_00